MAIRINSTPPGSQNGTNWLTRFANAFIRRRHARLDPRTLPDHLKRDMGFLDGNGMNGKRR